MSRKFMTLLSLMVILALVLGACGRGSGGAATPTPAAAAPAEAAATEAPAEAPTEAPAEPAASAAVTETAEVTETAAVTEAAAVTETAAVTESAAVTEAAAITETAAVTETPAVTETAAVTEAAAAPAGETPMVAGGDLEKAMAGDYKGKVVTMMGPFVEPDSQKFEDSIVAFEEATGIDIQYEGTKEFETIISTRVDGGNAPDIVDFPQPGLLANFVRDGKVIDVSTFLPLEYLQQQYIQSWIDMSTMEAPDGVIIAGVWNRFNGKSLVWYPKVAWDEAGYTVPTTWAELQELQDTIVSDGDTPWCIGIESGVATGWPATDWIEDIMLRTTSLDNYDKWTRGELKFASPEVKNAFQTMSDIWLNPDYVFGGTQGIVSTSFGNAPAPMFEDPPKCWLHRQANFITSFFPTSLEPGVDYDFFYFPPIDEEYGKPFLVAGDIYAMFNDRPEVRAVLEYFSRGESVKEWLAQGGTLAPQKDVQLEWYGSDVERGVAALAQEATSVRFDGSDLMPGEVGAGSFWREITSYISGSQDLDTTLEKIDASWPK